MERTNLQINQLHPYQYLTQLNENYLSCNKANAKSFSSVSTLKLAWKPFSIIKIPNCFEMTYENSHRGDRMKVGDVGAGLEDGERKIWKDHQDILRRYHKGKENKSGISRPQSCISRSKVSATGTGSTLSHSQSNLLLKRLMEKGVKLEYSKEEVKDQVLKKLKKIQTNTEKKKVWRVQSAINHSKKDSKLKPSLEQQKPIGQYTLIENDNKYFQEKKIENEFRMVDENQYMRYNKNSEIVADYKRKIKQVDCAIEDYNVKRAAQILRNMQNIVQKLD